MALTFYFDTHIAKAVATQLRVKGVGVVRCEEVGMAEASDEDHLQYATEHGLVMVSQDDDFLALDSQWHTKEKQHAGIMKVPSEIQGTGQISHLVTTLLFYAEAEEAGAIDYQSEILNHALYL